ncbi:MAG: hypothetical protein ACO4AJ_10585 [Prochlorothrix sp.]
MRVVQVKVIEAGVDGLAAQPNPDSAVGIAVKICINRGALDEPRQRRSTVKTGIPRH